ncbi:hypothetical protein OJF2_22030 [Aquisphaera giovannonii]|uniref:DUF2617 family protein n=1 Tax=Aquisphaera giovannonii TaxID=406548 RepID=A0A5B9W0B1_9BACT|nr:DUF2617 family protein [Aquisphaera giovannonii]QEH33697.1 hypothetical protein OJF2_22030 [Aquisphaera giovannonii]
MGVRSGRASVADLAFQVYDRALHPDWFGTRSHRRLSMPRWEADVRIIEGGHAVIFGDRKVRITELLAGREIDAPVAGRLHLSPVRSERSASFHPGGVIEYQTCYEVERLHPDVFRHICEELVANRPHQDLVHHVRSTNRLLPSPLSQVHVEPRALGLSVQCFHTFPEENAIVRSSSLYELTRPGGEA